jgi:hypothetical protein
LALADALPDDAEACDAVEEEGRGRAERMTVGDRGVIDRYKALCRDVESQEAKRAKEAADVALLQARSLASSVAGLSWQKKEVASWPQRIAPRARDLVAHIAAHEMAASSHLVGSIQGDQAECARCDASQSTDIAMRATSSCSASAPAARLCAVEHSCS